MIDIFRQIREERQDFLQNEIEVVPGYTFSQYNTIKKIHLYYNSHYEKGDYEDVNGVLRKKIFHNMSQWRCEVSTKMLDIDVKDFTLVSNVPDQDLNVFLLEKELKVWFKKTEWGQLLNQVSEELPIYGSVVLEKTKDGADIVDLRNLYNDQAAESLSEGRYTNIRYYLSHQDLRKMKGVWDNVEQAIETCSGAVKLGYDPLFLKENAQGGALWGEGGTQQVKSNPSLVEVWKRYGEVPLSWFTDKEEDENTYVLAKYVVAGIDNYTTNDNGAILSEDGIVLYKEQIDELPFKEVHYKKTKGRWLGIGVVETLFESQRRTNEVKNQEAKALEMGSIQVFQTRDDTIASNVMTDMQSGEIIKTKSEVTPIATESREMAGFKSVADDIEQHADNLTFSRDVVSGENPPASATLGAVQIQTAQTTAVFDYKRENIGLFLGEFIKDLVFPQLEAEMNREHVLRLTGSFDELLRLRSNYATNCANQEVIRMVIEDDAEPTQELYDSIYERYLSEISALGEKIWTKVKKNFFKNLDYEVDVIITGENKNVYAQINNASQLLGVIGKNPGVLQDPVQRKLLFKIMSNMGFHISELEDIENSVSELPANPMMQNGEQTIPGGVSRGQPNQVQTVPLQGQGQAVPA